MTFDDKVPHQKSLVIISLGFILFKLGEGEIKENITFALVGVKLNDPYWLGAFAWVMLLWSFWRFWINNNVGGPLMEDITKAVDRYACHHPQAALAFCNKHVPISKEFHRVSLIALLVSKADDAHWLVWKVVVKDRVSGKVLNSFVLGRYSGILWKLGRIVDAARTENNFADRVVPLMLFFGALGLHLLVPLVSGLVHVLVL